ncbi:MAG: hypothetical protein ABL921_07425 [Pirellula sp.]
MARSKQQSERCRQKKLARRKQRIDKQSNARFMFALTPKIEKALGEALGLIDERQLDLAVDRLMKLDLASRNHPTVIETLVGLHSDLRDPSSALFYSKKLLALQPTRKRALFLCGETALMAGMISQACMYLNRYLATWPDGEHAVTVKNHLDVANEDRLRRMSTIDLPPDQADAVLQLHEESLIALGQRDFKACVDLGESIISKAPGFVAAYNNMAIVLWHLGEVDRARHVLEQSLALPNCNSFSKALLAKYLYMDGIVDKANKLADELISVRLDYQDAALPICEALAVLGRDEDLLRFVETNGPLANATPEFNKSGWLHYHAYANCRLGNVSEAKRLWTESVKFDGGHPEAHNNLLQLREGDCDTPWPVPLSSWLPTRMIEEFAKSEPQNLVDLTICAFLRPHLLSCLLDRGNPPARQLAIHFAKITKSPESLKHLRDFAIGKRGSDSDRMSALQFLNQQSAIDTVPIPFYSKGAWTMVELYSPRITDEPIRETGDPLIDSLSECVLKLQSQVRFDESEVVCEEILKIKPNDHVTIHNQCIGWILRDGAKGIRRALPVLEKLLVEFPDYNFAKLTIAGLIFDSGGLERAKSLCQKVMASPVLHTTEALALFRLQVNMAATQGNYDAAATSYDAFVTIFSSNQDQLDKFNNEIVDRYGSRVARLITKTR